MRFHRVTSRFARKAPHVRAGLGRRSRDRTGVIYLVVLSIATLVMIMALGALLAARSLSRASSMSNDSADAANYAYSALEVGRWIMASDQYWRTDGTFKPGPWFTNASLGSGKTSLSVTTADSTFTNMTEDLKLLATGTKGQATQKIQLTLHSSLTPLSCLSYAIAVNGAVQLSGLTIGNATAGMASNTSVTASGSLVGLAVSAPANMVTGGYYQQTVQPLTSAIAFPDLSTVFSTYLSEGALVNYNAGSKQFNQQLISPLSPPPTGSANASGIYIINCNGGNFTIQNCRIVGTIVLLNAGTVTISGSVNWEPAVADYPCLLVQGNGNISLSKNTLQESSGNINYNPTGTPYPYLGGGTSNSNTTDTYPCAIKGLVYFSGNVQFQNDVGTAMGMIVVGGNLSASGSQLNPTYDSSVYSSPPPGFYTNTLTAAGYQRAVN